MKKRKLKGYVITTLYLVILGVFGIGITFLSKSLLSSHVESDENYNYSTSVFNETGEIIVNTEVTEEEKVNKPVIIESVSVIKGFYNKDDESATQENALIYYENTYMPNTGILYGADEAFEIYSVMDGKVTDIKTDEILGTVLTITHNDKVTSIYYSLGEVNVSVLDTVTKGQVIATSGQMKLDTSKNQTFLFEVYIDDVAIDPNTFYEKTINELNE